MSALVAIKNSIQSAPVFSDWPKPEPLQAGLRSVPVFDPKLLPETLRPWLVDIAERMQCPLDYVASSAVVVLSSLVGRRLGIRPKCQDNWLVVPNLWGAIVGPPGVLKTPAMSEVMKPLHRLEARGREAFDKSATHYKIEREFAERRRSELMRKHAKNGSVNDVLAELGEEAKEPTPKRYWTNDTTVEKLGELLNQNPNGLLVYRDELTGWLRTLERDGHESDRAFYLEAWNGNAPFTYDRIGRGTTYIESATVSLLGTIQPGPLAAYLQSAAKGGAGDDGLVQRFQVMVYPDVPKSWTNIDRTPDLHAYHRAVDLFERIDRVDFMKIAQTEEHESMAFVHFTVDAQAFFDKWRKELEHRVRSDDEHPIMIAHLAKYRKLMPALALVFHVVDSSLSETMHPVPLVAAERAAAWCEVLEAHARRIMQPILDGQSARANALADKIRSGKLPNPFTKADVQRKEWSQLTDFEDVTSALAALEELNWVRKQETATPGRPRVDYFINPSLTEQPEVAE